MTESQNFVHYDPTRPPPEFNQEMIGDIENFIYPFTEEERKKIFSIEEHIYNKTTKRVNSFGIPGIRPFTGTREGIEAIYYSRFSNESYTKMNKTFLETLPDNFPISEKYKINMPGIKITLPDGRQFYPLQYHGNLEARRNMIRYSSEKNGSVLGSFTGNHFYTTDGNNYSFIDLKFDKMTTNKTPKDW